MRVWAEGNLERKPIAMRKVSAVFRLRFDRNASIREIADTLRLATSAERQRMSICIAPPPVFLGRNMTR